MRVEILKEADEDIDSIWLYTAETWSADQANLYIDKLLGAVHDLSADQSGLREWQGQRYVWKRLKVERHFAFILEAEDKLMVVRILHEQMDFIKHLEA